MMELQDTAESIWIADNKATYNPKLVTANIDKEMENWY